MFGFEENPWIITILGGLIVSLIVRAISRPPSLYIIDLLIAISLFAVFQVIIMMMKDGMLRTFFSRVDEKLYWVFFEALSIIVIALIIENRQKARRRDKDS